MNNNVISRPAVRITVADIIALALIYAIPALSHAMAFPLYMFEPMRIVLFAAYLFSRNHTNAVILALTLPLFSLLTSGHPVLPKALLMSAELAVNVLLFVYLLKNVKWGIFLSLISATLVSKLLYYGVKFILIRTAVIDQGLITTNIITQILIMLLIAGIFHWAFRTQEE
ncbi:MAG: hypothetical protein U5N26_06380 [Candidatus Marinimicrobia bacterium]|nr:hypothetical protein [Candidatus Neomarinimicrobiota bacterium]